LNPQNIEQSEILFSAKTKDKLDWDTVNKLVEKSPDFEGFLKDLRKDCESNEVRNKNNYDECFAPEELSQHIKDKGIL
jgi:hypothetical protein